MTVFIYQDSCLHLLSNQHTVLYIICTQKRKKILNCVNVHRTKVKEEKWLGRRQKRGVHRSGLNWFWKILPSKQKFEHGYPNSKQCFYTNRQWLKFGTRRRALILRQVLNQSQQKLSCGPNLAHHQFFLYLWAKNRFLHCLTVTNNQPTILRHVKIMWNPKCSVHE